MRPSSVEGESMLKRSREFIHAGLQGYINERVVIQLTLLGLFAWVVSYGVFIANGFESLRFGYSALFVLVPLFCVDAFKMALETFLRDDFYTGKEELEKITIVIPTYNGAGVLPATLDGLLRRFNPEQIIVSSNGSTDDTCGLVRRYEGVRLIESKEPIGKVSAINVALAEVATPYCLIMDDDVLIGSATFPTDPLGEVYGGIAFRVLPKTTNWVTLIQAHEYRKSMDIGKVFHNARATVQNISGAIGLFKTGELKRQIEIHTGEFCGEDLQRTLLIHLAADNRGVVIVDSLVETEVPDTLPSLFKQRVYGWNPGMYSNFLNYLRLLIRKNIPWTLKYDAFYNAVLVTLTDPLRVVALPVLIFNPAIALVIYATYVFLESIPYLALKRKEPYWVVLAFPLYGIFNFVGRITAFAVFAYRRFAVLFARQDKPDDYRHAHLLHKFSGVIASQMLSLLLMLGMLVFYFVSGTSRLVLFAYSEVVKLAF